jgi:hypothetical protein
VADERLIARTLRGGAFLSGALFLASLLLDQLWPSLSFSVSASAYLRRAGASVLLFTPVARLTVAGAALGLRGERRFAIYAAGILTLLGLAVTLGFAA